MSLAVVFAMTSVAATAVAYYLHKSSAPLRRKAREEHEAVQERQIKEAREGREKAAREEFRIKLYSDLEQALSTPERTLRDDRYGSGHRGMFRWKALAELALFIKSHQATATEVGNLNERVYAQAKTIRELKGQLNEIHAALKLGQPVE